MATHSFRLLLEGAPYDIERRGDLIVVNGVEFPFAWKDQQILIGGTAHIVKVQGGVAEVDGISYPVSTEGLETPGARGKGRRAAGEEAGAVTALMAGLIVKILKREGDRVEVGDTIAILEAMKMQNDLQARVAGVVCQLNVREGEFVEMRQVLAVIR